MPPREDLDPRGSATLVVPVALSRIDALAVVALTLDRAVTGAGTGRPRVELSGDAWVEVEIPRFGDPPPVAVDVHSRLGVDHARLEALTLAERLRDVAGWTVRPDFPVG
jgi:hypothetical protein